MQKTAVGDAACGRLDQFTWTAGLTLTAGRTFVQALDSVTRPHCVRRGPI